MPVQPPTFRPGGQRTKREATGDYDRRRGSARDRGYTARWDEASLHHRAANPLCVGCLAVGRVAAAEVVDHIVPHRGDPALMWDPANRQSCCADHHNIVKQRLEALFDAGALAAADLSLASERAKQLTRELLTGGG